MTQVRKISGLTFAERCEARPMPRCITPQQKAGLSYQRKVGASLTQLSKKIGGEVENEPWFRFWDLNGQGQIVPDFLFKFADVTLVIEVKLTHVPQAGIKLQELYLPVIKQMVKTKVSPLVICRALSKDVNQQHVIESLAFAAYSSGAVPILHWLGRSPIKW